jgi:hypothetical protein
MDRQEKRDVGYEANASADGLINTQVVNPCGRSEVQQTST